jgi:shikimate kinase
MPGNIVLFGMMGVGKSTVGAIVARRLGREVVDTDAEIERSTGVSVAETFAEEGEPVFRQHEQRTVSEVSSREGLVVSVGGGAVLDDDNLAALRSTGFLVHLTAPAAVLAQRLDADGRAARPLLGDDVAAGLDRILTERAPRYSTAADVEIDARRDPEDVADDVIAAALTADGVLTPAERDRVTR